MLETSPLQSNSCLSQEMSLLLSWVLVLTMLLVSVLGKTRKPQESLEDAAFIQGIDGLVAIGSPASLRSSVVGLLGRPRLGGRVMEIEMGHYLLWGEMGHWSYRNQMGNLLWWALHGKWGATIKCGPDRVLLKFSEVCLAYNLIMPQLNYNSLMPSLWTPQALNMYVIASWPKMVQIWGIYKRLNP